MIENALRQLPSIDQLLRRQEMQVLIAEAGRESVRDRLREVLVELRQELAESNGKVGGAVNGEAGTPIDSQQIFAEIAARIQRRFDHHQQSLTRRVINATGIVIHNNLGRAPLSRRALEAISEIAGDYCSLESDRITGRITDPITDQTRGDGGGRGAGLEMMLRNLLGCEAAAVVNNGAAAVLITLNTLADGGEVIVSRGELSDVGGSFRIPEVIVKSGAVIRGVGTTNRTYLRDYQQAINERTRLILRVSPSDHRIVGFTAKPQLSELAELARAHHLPLFEDLGAGALIDLNPIGIHHESTPKASLLAGCSIVAFSGDKLLGGPQAGIILGEAELIARLKSNPLMRALRVDKLTSAALEATLAAYSNGRALEEIPTLAALHTSIEVLSQRARNFVSRARGSVNGLKLALRDGFSPAGGDCAPEALLPTVLINAGSKRLSAEEMERRLRQNSPPVIARLVENQLMLDLRTVPPEREEELITALGRLID